MLFVLRNYIPLSFLFIYQQRNVAVSDICNNICLNKRDYPLILFWWLSALLLLFQESFQSAMRIPHPHALSKWEYRNWHRTQSTRSSYIYKRMKNTIPRHWLYCNTPLCTKYKNSVHIIILWVKQHKSFFFSFLLFRQKDVVYVLIWRQQTLSKCAWYSKYKQQFSLYANKTHTHTCIMYTHAEESWGLSHDNYFYPSYSNDDTTKQEFASQYGTCSM